MPVEPMPESRSGEHEPHGVGVERRMPSARWRYLLIGLLLGAGAPVVDLLLRITLFATTIRSELELYRYFYLYELIGTSLVFGVAGFFAGKHADRLHRERQTYRELSERDELTGLANMRGFQNRYERAIEHARRYQEPVSLLFLDVDLLKEINDAHGHDCGSAALVHVRDVIHETKRENDLAARWGGDEFVILMPGAGRAAAERLAQAILDGLAAQPLQCGSQPVPVSTTIGLATLGPGPDDRNLIREADRALYEGKRRGRKRYTSAEDVGT